MERGQWEKRIMWFWNNNETRRMINGKKTLLKNKREMLNKKSGFKRIKRIEKRNWKQKKNGREEETE